MLTHSRIRAFADDVRLERHQVVGQSSLGVVIVRDGGNRRREGRHWTGLQLSVCEEPEEQEDGQSGDGARAAVWMLHHVGRGGGGFLVHGSERNGSSVRSAEDDYHFFGRAARSRKEGLIACRFEGGNSDLAVYEIEAQRTNKQREVSINYPPLVILAAGAFLPCQQWNVRCWSPTVAPPPAPQ